MSTKPCDILKHRGVWIQVADSRVVGFAAPGIQPCGKSAFGILRSAEILVLIGFSVLRALRARHLHRSEITKHTLVF